MSEIEKEREPWVWKAAIVALPVGLIAGVVIAMTLKISKGPRNEMVDVVYAVSDYNSAALMDSVSKLDNLLGQRSFSGEGGQQQMRSTAALIQGSLGPNNLGYEVSDDIAFTQAGKVWRNFWIESESVSGEGGLLIWADYTEPRESASVAALLSLAEWVRGRNFSRQITIAFVADPVLLSEIASGDDVIRAHVQGLGRGSRQLSEAEVSPQNLSWFGEGGESSAADWKLTVGRDYYLQQMNELTRRVSELAGESVPR